MSRPNPQHPLPPGLADFIKSQIEPTEPFDTILAYLKTQQGKRFDKRFLQKMNDAMPGHNFRLYRIAGMTHLRFGTEADPTDLLLAHHTGIPDVDLAYLLEHNPGYYTARDERNAKRQKALNAPLTLQKLETLLKHYLYLRARIAECFQDPNLDPDRLSIERAYGFDDHRR